MMLPAILLVAASAASTPSIAGRAFALGVHEKWTPGSDKYGPFVVSFQNHGDLSVKITGWCQPANGTPVFRFQAALGDLKKSDGIPLDESHPLTIGYDFGMGSRDGGVRVAAVSRDKDYPDSVNVGTVFDVIDDNTARLAALATGAGVGFSASTVWAIWGELHSADGRSADFSIPIYDQVVRDGMSSCFGSGR